MLRLWFLERGKKPSCPGRVEAFPLQSGDKPALPGDVALTKDDVLLGHDQTLLQHLRVHAAL
ncbi:hypothetical protein [Rhodopila globiformis]|uniref:Uncharacterized protein n=1 Tax=Rhodopila globiformis TaxID=1071 RepID=A0A2S6NL30_RHOGL|nr:hypothetical protein [Rhodopila globiformis]PPQ35909.1 hypothetical protein CCS01_06295 [Rhodopila globiformis]